MGVELNNPRKTEYDLYLSHKDNSGNYAEPDYQKVFYPEIDILIDEAEVDVQGSVVEVKLPRVQNRIDILTGDVLSTEDREIREVKGYIVQFRNISYEGNTFNDKERWIDSSEVEEEREDKGAYYATFEIPKHSAWEVWIGAYDSVTHPDHNSTLFDDVFKKAEEIEPPAQPDGLTTSIEHVKDQLTTPSNLVDNFINNSIRVTWDVNNETHFKEYEIEVDDEDDTFSDLVDTVFQDSSTLTVNNFSIEDTLWIRVKAKADEEPEIIVEWNTIDSAVEYEVQYRKTNNEEWNEVKLDNPSNEKAIFSAETDTNYDIRVRAINEDDRESIWSSTVTADTSGIDMSAIHSDWSDTLQVDISEVAGKIVDIHENAWKNMDDLMNAGFYDDGEFLWDTYDGDYSGENLRANTVQTQALVVGSVARPIQLSGIEFEANYNDVNTDFYWSSGILIRITEPGDNLSEETLWSIDEATSAVTLTEDNKYWIYAKCNKNDSTDASIEYREVDESQSDNDRPDYEDGDYYQFVIGILNIPSGERARFSSSYGFTFIDGNHIITGTLDANNVNVLTGSSFDEGGTGVEINSEGIKGYNNGEEQILIDVTDGSLKSLYNDTDSEYKFKVNKDNILIDIGGFKLDTDNDILDFADGDISGSNFQAGNKDNIGSSDTGVYINGNTGEIDADKGFIGGWSLGSNVLESTSNNVVFDASNEKIEVGSDYWQGDDSFQFGGSDGIQYPVDYDGTNKIKIGSDTVFEGELNAVIGSFDTVTVEDSMEVKGSGYINANGKTWDNNNAGFYMDYDNTDNLGRVNIGDENQYLKFSDDGLEIGGSATFTGILGADTVTADTYAEIRNTINLNFHENIDNTASGALEVPFHIPSETLTDGVREVLLSVKAKPFRAYSKTTAGGGGFTTTDGGHKHELVYDIAFTDFTSLTHYHTYDGIVQIEGALADISFSKEVHDHSISGDTSEESSHTHSYDKATDTSPEHSSLSWDTKTHSHGLSGSVSSVGSHDHGYDNTQPDLYTGDSDGGPDHDHYIGRSTDSGDTDPGGGHSHDDTFSVDSHSTEFVHNLSHGKHDHDINSTSEDTGPGGTHQHGSGSLAVVDSTQEFYFDHEQNEHDHTIEFGDSDEKTDAWKDRTGEDFGHRHAIPAAVDTLQFDDHSHTISDHSHNVDFEIVEDTDSATGGYQVGDTGVYIKVEVDNNEDGTFETVGTYEIQSNGNLSSNDEIVITDINDGNTDYITQNGYPWKELRLSLDSGADRIRLSGQLLAKIDLTA